MIHFRIGLILSNLDFYNDMKTLHIKTSKLCDGLFRLEKQGRYEDAMSEIGDIWQDKSELPDVEGLSPYFAAELFLRCGSLFGFLGHNKQIPNSQEKSRNLLTHARNLFLELYNVEKIAECENYLALAYWRTGEINEAQAWLEESFSHNLKPSNNTRIYSYIIKALVLLSSNKPDEILDTLYKIEDIISECTDNCLIGSYYNQIGIAWDILGNVPKALQNLESARGFYAKAQHKDYLGVVYNDLSLLYKTARYFEKAHQMIDSSTKIFKNIKDQTREAFSLDTKAQIFLSEGKFEEALKTIEKSVIILNLGENISYLIESYRTKIKILISMDNISAATFSLIEAVQIAKTKISEEAANNLVSEYESRLREQLSKTKISTPEPPDENNENSSADSLSKDVSFAGVELILPSPLSNFKDIQGIWINNTHLEKFGVVKDSLAIVVPCEEIKRGDLVAVEELENGSVSCGFYDNEFGIVCLESENSEPLLFDEENITVIGKIVGVGLKRTPDGKLIVEQLSL